MASQKSSLLNLKAVLSYCGTRYFGWQKTPTGPSIEETLEKALLTLLKHPVKLQAASRTDRGVHAEGQVVNFFVEKERVGRLEKALRAILPADILLVSLEEVEPSFHPSLDALGKQYHYKICNTAFQLPFRKDFSWHFRFPLDVGLMGSAAQKLLGEKDFSAFSNERVSREKALCTLSKIEIQEKNGLFELEIEGSRFLYCMVRNLVGMLVYIGCGKIPLEDLEEIIEKRDRKLGAVTAPAHGLFLKKVFYDHADTK